MQKAGFLIMRLNYAILVKKAAFLDLKKMPIINFEVFHYYACVGLKSLETNVYCTLASFERERQYAYASIDHLFCSRIA